MSERSIVRENLMNEPGYMPYCGNDNHRALVRAKYRNGQFECHCGWRSRFPADFIARYEARWADQS